MTVCNQRTTTVCVRLSLTASQMISTGCEWTLRSWSAVLFSGLSSKSTLSREESEPPTDAMRDGTSPCCCRPVTYQCSSLASTLHSIHMSHNCTLNHIKTKLSELLKTLFTLSRCIYLLANAKGFPVCIRNTYLMACAPGLCEMDVLRSIICTLRISGTPGSSLNVTEVLNSLKLTITATYCTYAHKHF